MEKKILIFSALSAATFQPKNSITLQTIGSIGVFTIGQVIYEPSIQYLPALDKYAEYIFPMLLQLAYNQIFYPKYIKKLIVEEAQVFATISVSRTLSFD